MASNAGQAPAKLAVCEAAALAPASLRPDLVMHTGLPAAVHQVIPFSSGMQVYAALDAGRTTSPGQDSAYRLSGVALGLRGSHKVNEAYPLQWDVFVSKPLARPDGFTTAKHTAGFTLRAEF